MFDYFSQLCSFLNISHWVAKMFKRQKEGIWNDPVPNRLVLMQDDVSLKCGIAFQLFKTLQKKKNANKLEFLMRSSKGIPLFKSSSLDEDPQIICFGSSPTLKFFHQILGLVEKTFDPPFTFIEGNTHCLTLPQKKNIGLSSPFSTYLEGHDLLWTLLRHPLLSDLPIWFDQIKQ